MCLTSRHHRPAWLLRATVAAALSIGLPAWAWQTGPEPQPPTSAPARQPSTQADPAIAQQQRQLQVFAPVLLNRSEEIDAQTRRDAAAEIAQMQIPEAMETLKQALQSRRPAVALAAIAALQAQPTPPALLLDACVLALELAPLDVAPSLSALLARYGDEAAIRVSALAQKPNATARLNAINALGSFRTRDAAAALMRAIENAPAGPSPLLDPAGTELARAALKSLERMTGLSYGQDLAAWRAWWSHASGESDEQWYRLISESLASRAALLQQQVLEQRQANDQTSRQLFSTYRDLFPALPIEEQLRRLPHLLQDKLPTVRQFGLTRVGVLTRDSVRMTAEIIELVRAAINDSSPDVRQSATELLDEMDDERAAEVIAARLATEDDPKDIAVMLAVLSHRPSATAIEPALRLLADDTVCDNAADALWQMMQSPSLSAELQQRVRDAARAAAKRRLTPSTLRLAALLGDERDILDLTEVLDGDDSRLRAAVAEGYWKRPLRQPLVDRADDEVIYPFAIRAVADGPADLAAFNTLVALKPSEANRALWNEMVVRLASRMQPAEILAADDSLRALAYADARLRRDVLSSVGLARETLGAADRMGIIERLAPLLIDLGDATRAWELLESLNGSALGALRVVHFQAAVLTGHYDRAATLQPDSAAWISLLGREVDRGNPVCLRLYDEIQRRFAEVLGPPDLQTLADIRAKLPGGQRDG